MLELMIGAIAVGMLCGLAWYRGLNTGYRACLRVHSKEIATTCVQCGGSGFVAWNPDEAHACPGCCPASAEEARHG